MRYQQKGPLDTPTAVEGDRVWQGVDYRGGIAGPGLANEAENLDFRSGWPQPRPGFESHAWGHDFVLADLDHIPNMDDIDFATPCGFGEVFGAFTFSQPGGADQQLLATRLGVWRIRPNAPPSLITVGDGGLTGPCEFAQAFDQVLLFRGTGQAVLEWNPALDFTAGENGFQTIVQTSDRNPDPLNTYGDGTDPLPNAEQGHVQAARAWVPVDDALTVSDILDYTRTNRATGVLRINAGTSGIIVRAFAAGDQQMAIGKSDSILLLTGVTGDLSALALTELTRDNGLAARHAVAQWGRDFWFLGSRTRALASLSQTDQGQVQAGAETPGGPVQPLLDRANWAAMAGAQMATHDGKLFLAFPLDGATYNNALAVYDGFTQAWAGLWTSPTLDAARFLKVTVAGQSRLAWVSGTGNADATLHGVLFTLGHDLQDWTLGTASPIATRLLTREYGTGAPGRKAAVAVTVELETLNPQYTVRVLCRGGPEVTLADGVTPHRTASRKFAGKPCDLSNADGSHEADGRDDYAVLASDFPFVFGTGAALGRPAHREIRRSVRARGAAVQVEISNASGFAQLLAVTVETASADNQTRDQA